MYSKTDVSLRKAGRATGVDLSGLRKVNTPNSLSKGDYGVAGGVGLGGALMAFTPVILFGIFPLVVLFAFMIGALGMTFGVHVYYIAQFRKRLNYDNLVNLSFFDAGKVYANAKLGRKKSIRVSTLNGQVCKMVTYNGNILTDLNTSPKIVSDRSLVAWHKTMDSCVETFGIKKKYESTLMQSLDEVSTKYASYKSRVGAIKRSLAGNTVVVLNNHYSRVGTAKQKMENKRNIYTMGEYLKALNDTLGFMEHLVAKTNK